MANASQNKAAAKAQATTQAAATGATDKAELKAYTTLVVVTHDDESYEIGSSIALTDKQAQPLLAVNAIQADDTTAE